MRHSIVSCKIVNEVLEWDTGKIAFKEFKFEILRFPQILQGRLHPLGNHFLVLQVILYFLRHVAALHEASVLSRLLVATSGVITVIIFIIIITAIVRFDDRLVYSGVKLTILFHSFALFIELNEILPDRHVQIWLALLLDDLRGGLSLRAFFFVALFRIHKVLAVVSNLIEARLFHDQFVWLKGGLFSFWFWAQTPLSLRLVEVSLLRSCHHWLRIASMVWCQGVMPREFRCTAFLERR